MSHKKSRLFTLLAMSLMAASVDEQSLYYTQRPQPLKKEPSNKLKALCTKAKVEKAFRIKGTTVFAYSKKDAIKRYNVKLRNERNRFT